MKRKSKSFVAIQQPELTGTFFDAAKALVYGPRANAYGHPSDNFLNISDLWNAYLKAKLRNIKYDKLEQRNMAMLMINKGLLKELDVPALNILQKLARIAVNPTHEDSWVDIVGYGGTAERIIKNK